MMKTVSSLVVRANAGEVRQLCSQALVQFLLDYPLGERRLQQHLEALAAGNPSIPFTHLFHSHTRIRYFSPLEAQEA